MEKKSLELTLQEAQGLSQVLDIATKAAGLQVAEFTTEMSKKLNALFTPEQPKKDDKAVQ